MTYAQLTPSPRLCQGAIPSRHPVTVLQAAAECPKRVAISFARRFTAAAEPLIGEIQVNVATAGHQRSPAAATSDDGSFVVVWRLSDPPGIFARRFTADGEPAGVATRLSPRFGSLAVDPDGGLLLTWAVGWIGDLSSGHFGQQFSPADEPEGGAFRISPRFIPIHRGVGAVRAASLGGGDYAAVYQLHAVGGPYSPRSATIWGRLLPREARAGTLSFSPEIPSDLEPGVDWAVAESPRSIELEVLRSGGATGEVSVGYFLESGAVEPGEDLSGTAGQLTFGEDEPPLKSFAVEILDDDRPEETEDAVFRLAEPTGGARLLAPETARLRIYDTDFNPPQLAPTPLGGEVAVATAPDSLLFSPRVAVSPQGGSVVVWERSSPVDFASEGVFARLYDRAGRPRGGEIRIDSVPPEGRSDHDVVFELERVADAGRGPGFAVLWHDGGRLVTRRFDGDGVARGDEFPVADCGSVPDPLCLAVEPGGRLARGAGGRLVAVWQTRTGLSGARAVVRALIDPDDGVTAEAVTPAGRHTDPALAADRAGNFVVAWQDRERRVLTARRFDGASRPLGEAFDLTPYDPWFQPFSPPLVIAMADAGHFAGAWAEVPGPGEGDVTARRFLRAGEPLGDPFRVPSFSWGSFRSPVVGADPRGHFLAVWEQSDPFGGLDEDGDGGGIFGRRYNWRWGPIGGELRINATAERSQVYPDVAVGRDGGAVVVWTSQGEGSQGSGGGDTVMMQRFAPGHCVPGADPSDRTVLCLQDGRFRLEAEWRDFEGNVGTARAAEALTRDTGHFWFFDEDNVEIVVKVLDGRALTGHFWVFYGSLSNVGYTLAVTDTVTGHRREYVNPAGRFASVGDVLALPGE